VLGLSGLCGALHLQRDAFNGDNEGDVTTMSIILASNAARSYRGAYAGLRDQVRNRSREDVSSYEASLLCEAQELLARTDSAYARICATYATATGELSLPLQNLFDRLLEVSGEERRPSDASHSVEELTSTVRTGREVHSIPQQPQPSAAPLRPQGLRPRRPSPTVRKA
jgi:hypothetical protein